MVGIFLLIMFVGLGRVRRRISAFHAPCPSAIKSGVVGLLVYLSSLVDDIGLYRRERRVFDVISCLVALSLSLYGI